MERLLKLESRFIHLLLNAIKRRVLLNHVVQTLSERLFIDVFLRKLLFLRLTWPLIEFFIFKKISVFFLAKLRLVYKANTLFEQFESYSTIFF